MQTVIEIPAYLGDAKALGQSDAEHAAIVDALAQQPSYGDVIPGTGGARKVRLGGRGKGKSGGYRVITLAAQNALRAILADVVAVYRGGVQAYVESRQQNPGQRPASPGVRHRRG